MGNPNCCFMIIAETFFFFSQSPRGTVNYYVSNSLAGFGFFSRVSFGSWNIYFQLNRVTAHSYKTYTLEWFSLNSEFSSDRFLICSSHENYSNFLEDLRVTTCFHEFFVATRKVFKISLLFSSNNELLLLALWSELKKNFSENWKAESDGSLVFQFTRRF